jgi:hypothetical protein
MVLALVLLGFQGSEEDVHHGLIGPIFDTGDNLAARFLGWSEERYLAAFGKLVESGEIVEERHPGARGYRLLGWDRFEAQMAQYGQRLYWRLRKRAKKAEVAV